MLMFCEQEWMAIFLVSILLTGLGLICCTFGPRKAIGDPNRVYAPFRWGYFLFVVLSTVSSGLFVYAAIGLGMCIRHRIG